MDLYLISHHFSLHLVLLFIFCFHMLACRFSTSFASFVFTVLNFHKSRFHSVVFIVSRTYPDHLHTETKRSNNPLHVKLQHLKPTMSPLLSAEKQMHVALGVLVVICCSIGVESVSSPCVTSWQRSDHPSQMENISTRNRHTGRTLDNVNNTDCVREMLQKHKAERSWINVMIVLHFNDVCELYTCLSVPVYMCM